MVLSDDGGTVGGVGIRRGLSNEVGTVPQDLNQSDGVGLGYWTNQN